MISNQWYAVLESKEVPAGTLVGVTRLGEKLVFWRTSTGEVACARDFCAHRGAALSLGKVQGDHVACPFHALEYDPSGACRLIPANGRSAPVPPNFRVQVFPVREAHHLIWVWNGVPRAEYPPLPFVPDIDDSFAYSTFPSHWGVHYSRCIENQLDAAHVPFVHYNTIGRGHRTTIDGPIVRWEGDHLQIWTYARLEDGSLARKAEEMGPPEGLPRLTFYFPNVWQNYLAADVRIVLLFTPIDEENTLVYTRFYHRVMRVPGLRQLISWTGKYFSRVIALQDRRVVNTQQPKKTALRMGENLFPADRPIVEYRRRREELISASREPVKDKA